MIHMKTKNIEEGREKEHSPHDHLFFIMSLAVICFMLLFAGISVVSATVTYDGTKIIISDGAENLTSINNTLSNASLLEQLSPKEWLLKVPILVQGPAGRLDINDSDCDMLKMKGLSGAIKIRAEDGASIFIDNVNITGWDITNNADIAVSDVQPMIESQYNNTLNVTNTYFKHVYIHYYHDETPDTVDNCTFFESNPVGISSDYSLYKTITHNKFYDCWEHNYAETAVTGPMGSMVDYYTYTNFSYNYAFGQPGDNMADNVVIGAGSTVIGNEIIYAGWNLIEIVRDTFCRDNILHDSGGNHNGFNAGAQPWDRYFINNYYYNIDPYSGNYIQLCEEPQCSEIVFPYRTYIINSRAENCGGGFSFHGGYDSYVYNFTSSNAENGFTLGAGNNYIRKSRFTNSSEGYPGSYYGIEFSDWNPSTYGYCDNGTVIDTTFRDNIYDMVLGLEGINQVVNLINTYNDASKAPPTLSFAASGGELREYVYLDVLVQDQNGNPIQGATITIENLVDANYPAINLTLPPPPPDLWELPEEPLPMPSIKNFTSITTGSDGHTPLPNYGWSPNPEPTIALMFQKRTSSGTTSGYSYKITAERDGWSNSTIVTPDSSWYRSDPNTYQNTITIVLPLSHERKLPVARPVCATGIAILIVIAYWRYRRRRRRMRSGGFIVLVPGITGEWIPFLYN